MKYIAYLILIATIGFNLWLYYPETKILADPNDNIFQFSLVNRTNWVWENYGCPFSISCLPNLVDHNVPNWAEGYPLPFYYSHIPQITIVSTYNLLIKPIASIFNLQFSIYNYYNWTKYLLLTFFPLSVFLALRVVGFSPILAAFGTLFSSFFSTDGLYGIDAPSYLWRGYGLTSQLYAIIFLPLAIAFTYKVLAQITDNSQQITKKKYTLGSIVFLTLTTAGHLGVGIIGILSTIPFLFFDLKPHNILLRIKKLFLIISSLIFVLSYWIIPILLKNNYHIISLWDPIWKFNSYGSYEVIRQFFAGEIFDWQRFPIITALVLIGFFVLLIRNRRHPGLDPGSHGVLKQVQDDKMRAFSALFGFWFLMYFGRTTWGGLIDLIPGMKDFHQHRFIVGVHIAAVFLIPAGLEYLFTFIRKIIILLTNAASSKFKVQSSKSESYTNIIFYILIFIFISSLIFFTAKQTVSYATLNNKWIYQANGAYRYDEKNFQNLLSEIDSQTKARIYAGRPGNWGKDFRLGSTQLYLLLGGIGYDISQFLPETWSPLSENEQNFDEREALDYDLLNIKYVVSSKNENFAPAVKLKNTFGPFKLYQAPTTGWFDVVTAPMFVKSDKTNYINLVHLWWNSYARRWKMHPLISVENNPSIPEGMQKVIEMKDEVSYQEYNIKAGDAKEGLSNVASPALSPTKRSDFEAKFGKLSRQDPQIQMRNIFSDYPFVFPDATVSGKIKEEKVEKQTYSATVEVPDNCKQCMIMFKMSFHPDWIAKLDGQEVEKFAIFPFYLAIPASPGIHNVEFTYQPNRLKIILLVIEIIISILLMGKILFKILKAKIS